MRSGLIFLLMLFLSTPAAAQPAGTAAAAEVSENADNLNQTVLQLLRDDEFARALAALGGAKTPEGLSAAAGGLHRALAQLSSDEQYDLLHKWSMPAAGQNEVRVLTSLVPETVPPMEFARALGLRPKKDSFSVASVGEMPGIFCSAWMMIVAADDVGNLRKLITELEGLAAKKTANAVYVLTLAKIKDSRTSDDELKTQLTTRVTGEADVPQPANLSDAVLAAAAMKREAVRPVCEQIAERLNQFDFAAGTSPSVSFLRRLRATIILNNRAVDVDPATVLYAPPQLWIAADNQNHHGHSTGADRAIWLTHEDHVKRLAGPGDDLLLFRYPLTGTFELKGEVTALDHGGAGLSYGGLAFDANQEKFTVKDVQRSYFESRIWPFIAPKELRMFNRVNIRSDGEKITFLSNLHPGWNGTPASCASCPWLGLRAFGDGRVYFRNLELVGEPQIPREVRIANSSDLRGWTALYGETTPKAVQPFMAGPATIGPAVVETPDWHVVEGIVHGRMSAKPETDVVAQSHLVYMRPLLDAESVSYEFFYDEGKTTVHPALGRLAFLIEPDGVLIHWLTDSETEWTGLAADNTVIEPLNRRGPRVLPLRAAAWNSVILTMTDGKVSVSLNGEEVYERSMEEITNHHIGFYHDRNTSAARIRNVVLTGDWPEKLSAEQLANLVATDASP